MVQPHLQPLLVGPFDQGQGEQRFVPIGLALGLVVGYLAAAAGAAGHIDHILHRFHQAQGFRAHVHAEGAVVAGGHLGHRHQLIQPGVAPRRVNQPEADAHGALLQGLGGHAAQGVQLLGGEGAVLVLPLAHNTADGAVAHILSHVDAQAQTGDMVHGGAVIRQIGHFARGPARFFLLVSQGPAVPRGVGRAAVAADIGGDALARLVVALRVAEHRHIGMGVGVDKPGGHIVPRGIQLLGGLGLGGQQAHIGDLAAFHGHIGPEGRVARPVDHAAVADDEIKHCRTSLS